MNRTHETHLLDVLRDVYDLGAATLPYRFLYRWFEAERLSKRVWAGLIASWQRVLEERDDEDGWQLGFVENGRSDIMTLICLDPPAGSRAGKRKSILRPVSELI